MPRLPAKIIEEMRVAIENKPVTIITDRREAIHTAIARAVILERNAPPGNTQKVAVLISGKGTDPYIMRANGKKEPWSDATVAEEELKKVLAH